MIDVHKLIINIPLSKVVKNNGLGFLKNKNFENLLLPDEYLNLLLWSNGGQIKFPKTLFLFYAYEELKEVNESYKVQFYLSENFLCIGSDGGSIAFILDYSNSDVPAFSSVNFGDLDINEVKRLGDSFEEGFRLMFEGAIDSTIL